MNSSFLPSQTLNSDKALSERRPPVCKNASLSCVLAQIATDYGTDPSLTSLLNTMDIYMLLLANPDGYAYTHTNVCRYQTADTR